MIKLELALNSQIEIINSYGKRKNRDNYEQVTSELYKYIKSITSTYYKNNRMVKAYNTLISKAFFAELMFGNENKLLTISNTINFKQSREQFENFIEYLVYSTRKHLIQSNPFIGTTITEMDLDDFDFTDQCCNAVDYVSYICNQNNIKCYLIDIFPGYKEDARILENAKCIHSRCHYANVVEYNGKYYLVDVTYSQFFHLYKNNLDRLGVVGFDGCAPGTFMLLNEERKNLAQMLVMYGYIELTENIFKSYLDGFTISFRNGSYYETTNDFSYTTDYTVEDYIKFLAREDSQINHEGIRNLGYQKKPLKDPFMNFRR